MGQLVDLAESTYFDILPYNIYETNYIILFTQAIL